MSWNNAECGLVWPQLETFLSGDSNFSPLYACHWKHHEYKFAGYKQILASRRICKYGICKWCGSSALMKSPVSLSRIHLANSCLPFSTQLKISESLAWSQPVWVRHKPNKCPHRAHVDWLLIAYQAVLQLFPFLSPPFDCKSLECGNLRPDSIKGAH